MLTVPASTATIGVLRSEEAIPVEIAKLVADRDQARLIKNFSRSDELRDELQSKGYLVEDTVHGTRVKRA